MKPHENLRLHSVALAVCLSLVLMSCGGSAATTQGSISPRAASPSAPNGSQPRPVPVIGWSEAGDRIGEKVTVEGPVVSVHRGSGPSGPAFLLDIGLASSDPAGFVAVIPETSAGKYPQPPAVAFDGRLVRVTGKIASFDGRPIIVVSSPKNIKTVRP